MAAAKAASNGSWSVSDMGTGEDAYEGLTAMLLMVPAGNYWQLDGVIAPGPFPEPPTSLGPATAE